MYDGLSGLLTQSYHGAKTEEESRVGFVKGPGRRFADVMAKFGAVQSRDLPL